MTKWSEIKAALMHLAINRYTWYSNSYPDNCLYVHGDNSVSCDCIGLIKNIINTPNQAYSTEPDTHGNPGYPVIPDKTEWGLINLCDDQSRDFSSIGEGEILMTVFDGCGEEYGHGGWFVGEFTDPQYGCIVNTIECTSAYEYNGIFTTYTDEYGYHWTSKGGRYIGQWDMHGHLHGYVDYSDTPQPQPTPPSPAPEPVYGEPSYCTYDDVEKRWLPIVKGNVDYAGIYGHDVSGIAIKDVKYQVHCWEGDGKETYEFSGWLEPVSGFDINDFEEGFAGNLHPIDALAIYTEGYQYQVHIRGEGWLDPVSSNRCDLSDAENGYAGIIGKPIDAVMIFKK